MVIKLSSLSRYNSWWKYEDWEKEDIILRNVEEIIPRETKDVNIGKIMIIRGIRRSGKSVYLRLLVKELQNNINRRKILYIPCDRYSLREIKNMVDEFRRREGEIYLLLDEITYLKNWRIILKVLGEESVTTVATGSNPVELKKETETLPGRGIEGNEYYFNPLNFREFIKYMNPDIPQVKFPYNSPDLDPLIPYYDEIESLFYKYILTGGFPEAVIRIKHNHSLDYIYEEIMRVILGEIAKSGKNENIAREILEYLLKIKGNRFDYLTIAREIGMSHPTVREYINLLENARIVYQLESWNLDKKIFSHKKQKKVVFQSSLLPISLAVYILGESPEDFVDKYMEFLTENTVASHIIWSLEKPVLKEKHTFAGFYYDANKECDLVIKDKKFIGIETKYGKVMRKKYPFRTIYLSKEELEDEDILPLSLYLAGIAKSEKVI